MQTLPSKPLLRRMSRWSVAKLERELAFADDNGGSSEGVAWVAALKSEVARRVAA